MDMTDALWPASNGLPWGVVVTLLAGALWRTPWKRLLPGPQLNPWLGSLVVLVLIWQLRAVIPSGLTKHLLGVALISLMVGATPALLSVAGALAVLTAQGLAAGVSAKRLPADFRITGFFRSHAHGHGHYRHGYLAPLLAGQLR